MCFHILTLVLLGLLSTKIYSSEIIDLTHDFDAQTIYWPTEKGFKKQTVFLGKTPQGYFYSAFKFCTPEHGGTHIDAPHHFSKQGLTVDEIKPENLMGEAVVIDVHLQSLKHIDYAISVKDIKDFEQRYRPLRAGDIVLFRTDWSQFWNDKKKYLGTNRFKDVTHLHFPGISKEAAHYLVDAKIKGVGIDTASLDPGNSKTFWAHRIILGANLYGLENLNQVHKLTPLKTYIIAAPMKIKGGSGGPTRVFALNRDLE